MQTNVPSYKRWVILLAIMVNNLCLAGCYVWSIFQNDLIAAFGSNNSAVALAYTLELAIMPIASIPAGLVFRKLIAKKYGIRPLVIVGALLWSAGWFLCGYATQPWHLYITYGLFLGVGSACLQIPTSTVAISWFPEKRGFATGMCLGCVGLGSLIWSPFGYGVMARFDVFSSFRWTGIVMGVAYALTVWLIQLPPEGWQPANYVEKAAKVNATTEDIDWRKMLTRPEFWCMWIALGTGGAAGLIMNGNASPIAQKVIGLSASEAAMVIIALSTASTVGRFFWAFISDKIGRFPAHIGIAAITFVATMLMRAVSGLVPAAIMICSIGACFGGLIALLPATCSNMFGTRNQALNYSILFTGYTIASFTGPQLAARTIDATGGYSVAFAIAGGMACVSVVAIIAAMLLQKKRKAALAGQSAAQ